MNSGVKASQQAIETESEQACPLDSPFTGRIPGVLSLLTLPAGIFVNPLFFGLAGGLLGVLSILVSPPRCRLLGSVGVLGSAALLVLGRL